MQSGSQHICSHLCSHYLHSASVVSSSYSPETVLQPMILSNRTIVNYTEESMAGRVVSLTLSSELAQSPAWFPSKYEAKTVQINNKCPLRQFEVFKGTRAINIRFKFHLNDQLTELALVVFRVCLLTSMFLRKWMRFLTNFMNSPANTVSLACQEWLHSDIFIE